MVERILVVYSGRKTSKMTALRMLDSHPSRYDIAYSITGFFRRFRDGDCGGRPIGFCICPGDEPRCLAISRDPVLRTITINGVTGVDVIATHGCPDDILKFIDQVRDILSPDTEDLATLLDRKGWRRGAVMEFHAAITMIQMYMTTFTFKDLFNQEISSEDVITAFHDHLMFAKSNLDLVDHIFGRRLNNMDRLSFLTIVDSMVLSDRTFEKVFIPPRSEDMTDTFRTAIHSTFPTISTWTVIAVPDHSSPRLQDIMRRVNDLVDMMYRASSTKTYCMMCVECHAYQAKCSRNDSVFPLVCEMCVEDPLTPKLTTINDTGEIFERMYYKNFILTTDRSNMQSTVRAWSNLAKLRDSIRNIRDEMSRIREDMYQVVNFMLRHR